MGGAQIWKRTANGHPQDPLFLFVKEKLSMNSVDYNRSVRALEARRGLQTMTGSEENLGRFVHFTKMVDSSWCTNYYKTYTATEYYTNNLEFNLRMKRDLNQDMPDKDYNQDELTYIMGSVASGAQALSSVGLFHGDIQPRNVMMGEHGEVKLMEKPLLMQYYTGFSRMLFDQDYQSALSPQQLVSLRNARLSMYDPIDAAQIQPDRSVQTFGESEEVFAMGMTQLAASTNHPISRYYDFQNYVIKRDLVNFDLDLMKSRGLDNGYVEMVSSMIQENPNLRPSLEQIVEFTGRQPMHQNMP